MECDLPLYAQRGSQRNDLNVRIWARGNSILNSFPQERCVLERKRPEIPFKTDYTALNETSVKLEILTS
jgi:hypothetical protein